MSTKKKKFYITTPIYYVNDQPHIGHSYTTIAADVLARYHRIQKEKVFFSVGVDEHGAKIEEAAEKKGKTPKQLCDENSKIFEKIWQDLNISYDNFIRTTDPYHKKIVQKVLKILHNQGIIYKGIYEGLYCVGCEQYKTKSDLVNGKCPEHQTKPVVIKEENYIFKLSQFENILREKIEKDEFEIRPKERKKEVLQFLKNGLQDISISRQRVKWGVVLPFDKAHTAYVWMDAFLNYLTVIGWDGNAKRFPKFWPPDLQLMSKDILRVHATIWPALLLALNIPLPKKLFVHGYFTINAQKMSKTIGNVIWPNEMIEKFGVDGTRYLLLSACPFGRDGDISWEKLLEKYNADLAKGLGNLTARTLALAVKQKTPAFPLSGLRRGKPAFAKATASQSKIQNPNVKRTINKTWKNYKQEMDEFKLNSALEEIWKLIGFCDRYIEKEKPWEQKDNQLSVINDLLIALSNIAEMLAPFMTETSEKILKQIKLKSKGKPLFPRI